MRSLHAERRRRGMKLCIRVNVFFQAVAFATCLQAQQPQQAQDLALCGPVPSLPVKKEDEEKIKGQLQGEANLLSRMVGEAEIAGQVETARKQLYQDSSDFFAAQKDAYLAYLFCMIIRQDPNADYSKKLEALQAFRSPAPRPASLVPLTMTLLDSETQPLDGYAFIGTPQLPAGVPSGKLLPGGGRTRLVFQAADPESITQIDKLRLVIDRQDSRNTDNMNYLVDPTKQPGFGGAKPRRYNVNIAKNETEAYFVNDNLQARRIKLENVLNGTEFPLLLLDRSAGLQETLDFTFAANTPGFYSIYFVAHATSEGREFELHTNPFYIFAR